MYFLSDRELNATLPLPAESVSVPTDIASVQHGQHIVGAIAVCTRCHGPNLAGSVVMDDDTGRVVAPNLTGGGVSARLRDADLARAIRDGLDPGGRALWLMPSDDYHGMSDLDLGSVIAFLRSLPAVPNTSLPSNEIHPLGRVLLVSGQLPLLSSANIDRSAPQPRSPEPAANAEYGQYLVQLAGCARCHGLALSGGKVPGAPPGAVAAANLTSAALGSWSDADFLRAMRTGRRPDNGPIDTLMPWPYYAQMSDLELRAIWQFLEIIPPR